MNISEYSEPRSARCDCFAELEMRLRTPSAQSGPLMALQSLVEQEVWG